MSDWSGMSNDLLEQFPESIDTSLLSLSSQTDYSLEQLIPPIEYDAFEHKICSENQQQSNPFFNPYKFDPSQQYQHLSPYHIDYLKWKEKKQTQEPQDVSPSLHRSTHHQQDRINLGRQVQLQKLRQELRMRNDQKSYDQMQTRLKNISKDYRKKVSDLINKQQQDKKELEERKKLQYYQIDYPQILTKDDQFVKEKEKSYCTSFVDLIKRPPRNIQQQPIQLHQLPIPEQSEADDEPQSPIRWKLDIHSIKKMPAKQFLLFYGHYQKKIIALSTPEQLKQLNKYRQQALEKQDSLRKLRRRIATGGDRMLSKLPAEKKRQLFELLYEDQLDNQIQKLSMSQ